MPPPAAPLRTAVLLAAGLGSRLRGGDFTGPKGLLPLGGQPLVARSLATLRAAGISHLVAVIGHRAGDYRDFFAHAWPAATLVENPDYARTGSMHSLFLARAAVGAEDFLLVESDLIYEPHALTALLTARPRAGLLLSGPTGQGDEVHTLADAAGHLAQLTKTPPPGARSAGEFTGISRISTELFARLCAHYAPRAALPNNYAYDDCLGDVATGHAIPLVLVPGLAWGEVDNPLQLARAEKLLLPALAARA